MILKRFLSVFFPEQSETSLKILRPVECKITAESGRSMVEMLGVLAIVGVLSVMGIAGFRRALHSHEANTIVYEANMHTTTVAGNALLSGLSESVPLYKMSYDFTYKKESDISYSLSLSGIEEGVCKQVQNLGKPSWAELVLINNGSDCSGDNNTIAFYVNTNVTSDVSKEDRVTPCDPEAENPCGECGVCNATQRVCVFDNALCTDPSKSYCNKNYKHLNNDTYVTKSTCQACPEGQFKAINNQCIDCNDTRQDIDATSIEACHACGNRYSYTSTICTRCDTTATNRNVSWSECSRCGNRYNPTQYGQTCYRCDGLVSADGKICTLNCPPGSFSAYSGSCVPCDSSTQAVSLNLREAQPITNTSMEKLKEYCSTCSNRTFIWNGHGGNNPLCAKNCPNEGEFLDTEGNCRSCSSEWIALGYSSYQNHPDCTRAKVIKQCRDCPGVVPVTSNGDGCYQCTNSKETLSPVSANDCINQCKGIRYVSATNKCTLCPTRNSDAWNALTAEQQTQCTTE